MTNVFVKMNHILRKSKFLSNFSANYEKKYLWEWINIMFNKVDEERLKLYGPDRTCAEWLLKNGACVKWVGYEKYLRNYNRLPPENVKLYIKEVDATGSSIKHYGFPHFRNCNYIDTVILNESSYIEDKALEYLRYLANSLTHLQVSNCKNITSNGLLHLTNLHKLQKLIIYDLPYVKDKDKTLSQLQKQLPNCTIDFK